MCFWEAPHRALLFKRQKVKVNIASLNFSKWRFSFSCLQQQQLRLDSTLIYIILKITIKYVYIESTGCP